MNVGRAVVAGLIGGLLGVSAIPDTVSAEVSLELARREAARVYADVVGPHQDLPPEWRGKVDMVSGDISRPYPFTPGWIQVYHAPGRNINALLPKHGLHGPAHLVNPRPFTERDLRAGLDRIFKVAVPVGTEKAAVQLLARSPLDFLYVGLFWITPGGQPGLDPTDTLFVGGFQGNFDAIGMRRAWDRTTSFDGVRIAIIDTGLYGPHEDAAGKQVFGYDFVNGVSIPPGSSTDFGCEPSFNGHGTNMAIIAAGATNNGKGIAAAGFNSTMFPIRVYRSDCTWATTEGQAYIQARNLAAVIVNMSFSGVGQDLTLRNELQVAWQQDGVGNVANAGNQATSVPQYPCAFPYVMCVGAANNDGSRWSGSNFGSWVTFAAPGMAGIWTGHDDGGYISTSGTSIATATVSGVAALLRSWGCNADRQLGALVFTAKAHPDPAWTANGFINAGDALYWYGPNCL